MRASCNGRSHTFSESLIGQWLRAVANQCGFWAHIADQRSEWASGWHSGRQRLRCGGQSQGGMSMSWDPTARRHHRLSLLLVLVLLSRAGALRPVELFPYGEFWGDLLPREGDVESSPAVKLAVPLCFYCDQFSNLYPSPHSWLTSTRVTAVAGSCMEDTSRAVLSLAACYLCTGFPPTHFFLATWEQVGAKEEDRLGAAWSGEL